MKKLIIGSFLLIIMAACTQKPFTTETSHTPTHPGASATIMFSPTATPAFTPTPTPTATRSFTPTKTLVPSTSTPAVTNTPPIPPEVIRYRCLEVNKTLPSNTSVKGKVVLAGHEDFTASLFDMATKTITMLPKSDNAHLIHFALSPDRRMLAYEEVAFDKNGQILNTWMKLYSSDNELPEKVLWDQYGISFDWLDNEHLITNYARNSKSPFPLVILDPFSMKRTEVWLDATDITFDRVMWGLYSSSKGVPNAVLTRIIYPSDNNHSAVLRNLQTGENLGEIPYGFKAPKWSPDGSQAAVISVEIPNKRKESWYSAQEFFLISADGAVKQLTHLSDYFDFSEIREFNWSPDGHFIAFWLSTGPDDWPTQENHLAVVDTTTGSVIDYCVVGEPHPDFHNLPKNDTAPIWSPDGTQLLIEARNVDDTDNFQTIIVDIIDGWAAQIAENLTPVGWMVAP